MNDRCTCHLLRFPISALVFLVFLAFSCSTTNTTAQDNQRQKRSVKNSPQLTDYSHEVEQIEDLKTELAKDPDNVNLMLELATLYMDTKMIGEAKELLITLSALPQAPDNRVYATLAQIHYRDGEYQLSLNQYQKFLTTLDPNSPTYKKTEVRIEQTRFNLEVLSNPYPITPLPLPLPINSAASEYLPQFTLDQENIVFTRRWYGQEDIFVAKRQSDKYEVTGLKELNTPLNEGAHTLSADGNLIIFTHCNEKYGFGSCDLYRAHRTEKGWTRPSNMGSRINTLAWESQPSLSANGDLLYFSSNRPGGMGGSDIWVSKKSEDGTWGLPINLGSKINTRGNEESPFIHADAKSLYFRSTGHQGLGSFDIFLSKNSANQWSNPIHLGAPINSIENDGALVISLDGLYGYYASNYYNGNKKDDLDIYQFNLPLKFRPRPMTYVKGRVTSQSTKYPVQAEVKVRDLRTGEFLVKTKVDHNGEFLVAVPVQDHLAFSASSEEHTFHSVNLSFSEIKHGADPYYEEIQLQDLEVKIEKEFIPIVLSNVFFETGSAKLLEESSGDIQLLYDLLIRHPKLRIKINGHTDDVGREEDNLALSLNRANSVKNALKDRGIPSSRIESQGFGESSPVADNSTPEGRAQNRRTEFVIIQ